MLRCLSLVRYLQTANPEKCRAYQGIRINEVNLARLSCAITADLPDSSMAELDPGETSKNSHLLGVQPLSSSPKPAAMPTNPYSLYSLRLTNACDPNPESKALALHQQGKESEALHAYLQLISAGSSNALIHANAGLLLRQSGRSKQALTLLRRSVEIDPDKPELHYNLANALADEGQLVPAIKCYQRAVSLQRDFPDALFNLGNTYKKNGDLEAAIACYNKALNLRPQFAEAWFNLGNALLEQQLFAAAVRAFQNCLQSKPDFAEAWYGQGQAYYEQAEYAEAINAFRHAIGCQPRFKEALFKLGNAQREKGEIDAAIQSYHQAIAMDPEVPEAHFNLAIFYRDLGQLDAAIECFRKATRLNPNYAEAQRNLALALLLVGQFQEGWHLYVWRKHEQKTSAYYTCEHSWQPGQDRPKVLIVGEQGAGDQVMFASMLSAAQAYASELTVQTDPRLVPVLQRSLPTIRFIDHTHPAPEKFAEKCLPMGSLGNHFGLQRQEFIQRRRQYLVADQSRTQSLRQSIAKEGVKLCGISWNSVRKDTGPSKSIALARLAPALALAGVRLVSLQYGDVSKEIRDLHRRTGIEVFCHPQIDNFYDLDGLVALINACDFVVSTSNTAAHLAGALGKTTLLLLQHIPDWRWGLDHEDTLWYPRMRLIRQRQPGDWEDVLSRARTAVQQILADGPASVSN